MKTKLPKDFEKHASSPTRAGIEKQIARFYAGEEKDLRPDGEGRFSVHSRFYGTRLSTVVIETSRGFYFGTEYPLK